MARALITEDRLELGRLNPLIGGDPADTLQLVRAAVAFIGHGADHAALLDASSIGVSPAAYRGEALLARCIDIALKFEVDELSVIVVKAQIEAFGTSEDHATARAEIDDSRTKTKTTSRKRS